MPLEGVCIHLLQSECGGPTTISCEVTQTILSLRDNTVCSRHTLQTVQRTQCAGCSTLLGIYFSSFTLLHSSLNIDLETLIISYHASFHISGLYLSSVPKTDTLPTVVKSAIFLCFSSFGFNKRAILDS